MPWAMLSSVMFLAMELVQLFEEGWNGYFKSAWNFLDMGAFSLQLVVDLQVLIGMHPDWIRPTASVSVLLLVFKVTQRGGWTRVWAEG